MKKFAIIGFAATALIAGCSSSNDSAAMDDMDTVETTQPSADNYEVIIDPKSGRRTVIDRTTGQVVR